MSQLEKKLIALNIVLYGFLAVFSYSYVDLNLTLSKVGFVNTFVSTLQQLGYYHRTLATSAYILFIAVAFSFFGYNLYLFKKSKISARYLKVTTCINTALLVFAYPFLSSDLFNYLFDAKIIHTYQVSPYTHKPLDFPNDEWLRFMRWIHRYSPYGPLWLGMSLLPTVLGFGKFIATLFLFKIFIGAFHIINTFLILKITEKLKMQNALFYTAFYAFNPLFLIEGVVNAHNDVVMATFLIGSVYFVVANKPVLSYFSLLSGALVKYISILNLPWFILYKLMQSKNIKMLILSNAITMAVFTVIYSSLRVTAPFVSSGSTQVQFQPWYLFWSIPYVSLVSNLSLVVAAFAVCVGASLRYLPFLYYGDWSQPGTSTFMQIIVFLPLIILIPYLLVKKHNRL